MWLTVVSASKKTGHMLLFMPENGGNLNHIKTSFLLSLKIPLNTVPLNHFAFT